MPHHALVIDDEPSIRALIVGTLADDGWTASEAANGVDGLRKLELEHFDVIVLDLNMPVMDGRTFYRAMLTRGPAVPTLILSANGARGAASELGTTLALTLGLEKPFDLDEFSAALKMLSTDAVHTENATL